MTITLLALPAAATEVSLQRGMPISQVRAQLIKNGWIPVRMDKIRPIQERINPEVKERKNLAGNAQDLFKAGFYEVEKCVGADFNECIRPRRQRGEPLR